MVRKINAFSVLGTINVIVALIFFASFDIKEFNSDCFIILGLAPLVFLLNRWNRYILALYLFYIMAFGLLTSLNLKMGKDSFIILFYFPVIISLVQLAGRRETIRHLIALSVICLMSVLIVVYGFLHGWQKVNIQPQTMEYFSVFNILITFTTSIAFIIVVVNESLTQEKLIKQTLKEKEILLAEVFHRVKNNMNIVTSLLNLKKNTSDSDEVKNALEDCRNRVYSMALVHQKVYDNNNIGQLNFKEYLIQLVNDIVNSFDGEQNTELHIKADEVILNLSAAIPCGLIINELITNSFKYAKLPNKKLVLDIELSKKNDVIHLSIKDNGPGLASDSMTKSNTLGFELIKSLCDQIDANFEFISKNGLQFKMDFKN